jgi:hypothetical protein
LRRHAIRIVFQAVGDDDWFGGGIEQETIRDTQWD